MKLKKVKCKKVAEILNNSVNFNILVWDVINKNMRVAHEDGLTSIRRLVDHNDRHIDDSLEIYNFFSINITNKLPKNLQKSLDE